MQNKFGQVPENKRCTYIHVYVNLCSWSRPKPNLKLCRPRLHEVNILFTHLTLSFLHAVF